MCILINYTKKLINTIILIIELIIMKPTDVKSNTYFDFQIESNKKDLKFKVSNHVRISKYKNIFTKGYKQNWSK